MGMSLSSLITHSGVGSLRLVAVVEVLAGRVVSAEVDDPPFFLCAIGWAKKSVMIGGRLNSEIKTEESKRSGFRFFFKIISILMRPKMIHPQLILIPHQAAYPAVNASRVVVS